MYYIIKYYIIINYTLKRKIGSKLVGKIYKSSWLGWLNRISEAASRFATLAERLATKNWLLRPI